MTEYDRRSFNIIVKAILPFLSVIILFHGDSGVQRSCIRYIPLRIVTGVIAEAFLADFTEKSSHRFLFLEQFVWVKIKVS